jgi:pyruvate,water dikinase
MPPIDIKIMIMNVLATRNWHFDFCQIPNRGVGTARLRFIIGKRSDGVHPKAILVTPTLMLT